MGEIKHLDFAEDRLNNLMARLLAAFGPHDGPGLTLQIYWNEYAGSWWGAAYYDSSLDWPFQTEPQSPEELEPTSRAFYDAALKALPPEAALERAIDHQRRYSKKPGYRAANDEARP